MSTIEAPRPPFPPFNTETAAHKVRLAEDAWNTRNPERVSLAYTFDSVWRNRSEFLSGREAIVHFLRRKWNKELDYRLIKELWAFHGDRIAVRFAYGLMRRRIASINDLPISEPERRYRWPLGRRPDDHPTLSELGL
jgi:nuclear transport factor 2 (NTF2) superfamily protein